MHIQSTMKQEIQYFKVNLNQMSTNNNMSTTPQQNNNEEVDGAPNMAQSTSNAITNTLEASTPSLVDIALHRIKNAEDIERACRKFDHCLNIIILIETEHCTTFTQINKAKQLEHVLMKVKCMQHN